MNIMTLLVITLSSFFIYVVGHAFVLSRDYLSSDVREKYFKAGIIPLGLGILNCVLVIVLWGGKALVRTGVLNIGSLYNVEEVEKDVPNFVGYTEKVYITNSKGEMVQAYIRADEENDKSYYIKERYELLGIYFDESYLVIGTKDEPDGDVSFAKLAKNIEEL